MDLTGLTGLFHGFNAGLHTLLHMPPELARSEEQCETWLVAAGNVMRHFPPARNQLAIDCFVLGSCTIMMWGPWVAFVWARSAEARRRPFRDTGANLPMPPPAPAGRPGNGQDGAVYVAPAMPADPLADGLN